MDQDDVRVCVGGGSWSLQTMKVTHPHVSKSSPGMRIGRVQRTHMHIHTNALMHTRWDIPQAL